MYVTQVLRWLTSTRKKLSAIFKDLQLQIVDTFQGNINQVLSICYQLCLVLAIMLDVKNQMYPNILVPLGRICLKAPVLKRLVFILGLPFKFGGILPLSISMLFIYLLNCINKVSGYLIAKLIFGHSPIEFNLVNWPCRVDCLAELIRTWHKAP